MKKTKISKRSKSSFCRERIYSGSKISIFHFLASCLKNNEKIKKVNVIFWKNNGRNKNLLQIKNRFDENFGTPHRIVKYNWKGGEATPILKDENFTISRGFFYIFEYAPTAERVVWTYVSLGMSEKSMLNAIKSELIWLSHQQSEEIFGFLPSLVSYPFHYSSSFDYGQTISNSEAISPFSMNTLLICPAFIKYQDSKSLFDLFDLQGKELFWLLPIHNTEKEYMGEKGDFSSLFDLWQEIEIDPVMLCDLNRVSTLKPI